MTIAKGGRCAKHPWQATGSFADRSSETTTTARGYGWQWQQMRNHILLRDGYLCQCAECKRIGRMRPATEVDHVIPKAQGGSDRASNLAAINIECHRAKTELEANSPRGGSKSLERFAS